MKYVAPKRGEASFTCPHCGVLSQQFFYSQGPLDLSGGNGHSLSDWLATSVCGHCGRPAIWLKQQMLWPNSGGVPMPNPDMPEDVAKDYMEAAQVAQLSPKSAAALLRLAIQKLCVDLGGSGHNINDDIAALVAKGLPVQVQQSLDIVRVVGNNAVHPGQIDIDDQSVVGHLFGLLNLIVETMISTPKKISGLYASLPKGALDAIEKRDEKKKKA